jgi:hypothetical protein
MNELVAFPTESYERSVIAPGNYAWSVVAMVNLRGKVTTAFAKKLGSRQDPLTLRFPN